MNENPAAIDEKHKDYMIMYYSHQYDRMAQLENQRMTISNMVIGITILVIAFGFRGQAESGGIMAMALIFLVSILNVFAIAFIARNAHFTRMHRERANAALRVASPELQNISDSISWPRRRGVWGLNNLHLAIHIVLILATLLVGLSKYLGLT